MAVVMELKIGNATVYVCDDAYRDITPEEMALRKRRVREAMGRIAVMPGAAERLEAYRKREERRA